MLYTIHFKLMSFTCTVKSSQIAAYTADREIFYKQREAKFFRTASYDLANSASKIPLVLGETVIFGALVYFLCGFEAEASLFLIFDIVLFFTNLAMGMWFFFLSSVGPNANIVTCLGMCSILVFSHEKALSINQYRASGMDVCVYDGVDYCAKYGMTMGKYYLDLFGLDTEKSWVTYGIIYMAAIYVVFMILSGLALEFLRYETPKMSTFDRSGEEFVPVTKSFQGLHYFVPDPHNPKESLELLKGINGFAVPGSIVALMGSSGAGKTTLMDVIEERKTGGKITGRILLNGYEANDLAIRRCTGYCATIREALTFSSFLRSDASISDDKRYDSVNESLVGPGRAW
ncbi:hypothetical protein PInf_020184 [Phytophthora infestans]|nr:hypothetical protein PInf_020184 [Phytophthora infestans]